MRHAPYSTFSDATPLRPVADHRTTRWARAALTLLVDVLTLPRRLAAIRRDMALLGQMSAYELADIGLSRQDVWDAAAMPFGQSPWALLRARVAERRRAR